MKPDDRSALHDIQRRAERLQHSRSRPGYNPLRGISAFGVVGWSIAIPTVGGALLGRWLNRVAPQTFSWTIALILGGLVIGLLVAWEWIARESRQAQADAAPQKQDTDDA